MPPYGFEQPRWDTAKTEVKEILVDHAGRNSTLSYSDLTALLTTIDVEPQAFALSSLLEEVAREEHAAGRGMLTAVVVHRGGDEMPGDGFFKLAEELGYEVGDREDFWRAELDRVWEEWSEE